MSICAPCQVPHTVAVCEDTRAGRVGMARACFCQHKPRTVLIPPAGERTTEVTPGPAGEAPGGVHPGTHSKGGNTVMPSRFAHVMVVGAATCAPEIAALNAAGLPTTFLHTGGGCTALQVRCAPGRHLLITDAQDSLAWSRDAQQGWAVGAYRDDAAEEPESLHTTNDSTTAALLTLVRHTLCSVRQPWAQDRGR